MAPLGVGKELPPCRTEPPLPPRRIGVNLRNPFLWEGFKKSDAGETPGTSFPSHDRLILLAMAGVGMAILIPKAVQSSRAGSTVAAWLFGIPAGLCAVVVGVLMGTAVLGAVFDYIEANCGQPVAATSFHHGSFWFAIFVWFSIAWIRVVFFTEGTGWHHLGMAAGVAAVLGYPMGSFLGLYFGRMPGYLKLPRLTRRFALPNGKSRFNFGPRFREEYCFRPHHSV